mmetsp:Transcript_35165/g.100171  ORF Transcript_35165/g.100171 Transcript_35165/m.100171 type:complete len:315 (+) Transcript_35165:286-1230(+)
MVDRTEECVHCTPQCLFRQALGFRAEVVATLVKYLELGLHDLLCICPPCRQERRSALSCKPIDIVLDLLFDEPLSLVHLLLSLRLVPADDLPEIVHRVGGDAVDITTTRRDVERHRDVDEHEAPGAAAHVLGTDDGLLGPRRRKDDIRVADDTPQVLHRRRGGVGAPAARDDLVVEQRARSVDGPVDHGDADVWELAEEGDDEEPRHLPGAEDSDAEIGRRLSQVGHGLHRHELDRRARGGDGAFADAGLRPDVLPHPDRRLQHPRDELSSEAGRPLRPDVVEALSRGLPDGVLVASLHLCQNLGLAEHQGVQT